MPKILWAPWRMAFIERVHRAGRGRCIFCDLPSRGVSAKTLVIHRGKRVFVILNRYPYTNGHLMVVPIRHVGDIGELTSAEHQDLGRGVSLSIKVLKKGLKAQGFNVGLNLGKIAGAGIDSHIHYHVVPRWQGDSNFVPVIGGIRTLPEYIETTYKRLRPLFVKMGKGL